MPGTAAEQALSRALDYLADSGVPLNDEVTRTALALIDEGMRTCPDHIVGWLMEQIPLRYGLPGDNFPMTQPPLCRGSIGYGRVR